MGKLFVLNGDNLTVANTAGGSTLAVIRAAAAASSLGGLLKIVRVVVTQRNTVVSTQLGIAIGRKVTAFGTYVSATPAPMVIGGPASAIAGGTAGAAATCGVTASAEGAGAFTPVIQDNFNVLNGYLWQPTPDEELFVPPGEMVAIKFLQTMTILTGWDLDLVFEEIA